MDVYKGTGAFLILEKRFSRIWELMVIMKESDIVFLVIQKETTRKLQKEKKIEYLQFNNH